jgi:hypothetical protein
VTMLAWEDPYDEDNDPHSSLDNYSLVVSFFFCILNIVSL